MGDFSVSLSSNPKPFSLKLFSFGITFSISFVEVLTAENS